MPGPIGAEERATIKWLTRAGEIGANPAADLDLPRKLKRLPRFVLTECEAERVMGVVDLGTSTGLRDRAFLEVLYATGMRRNEQASLQIDDLDAERDVVLMSDVGPASKPMSAVHKQGLIAT